MKFNKIHIENLTSLRGKHELSFKEILDSDQLFAITGKTGAGKSTLLSAISLALYGDNYKTTLKQSDLVSSGEKFGRVELWFEQFAHKYKCEWECKIRKKDGTLLKMPRITRNFYKNDQPIGQGAEEITGLSFDQFCKTVILNQGEFSRFLASSFRERKEILEKLYNGKEISLLGRVLKERIKVNKRNIENLQAKLEGRLPVSKEEAKKLKIEFKKNEESLKFYNGQLSSKNDHHKEITQFINQVRKFQGLKFDKIEYQKKHKIICEEYDNLNKIFIKEKTNHQSQKDIYLQKKPRFLELIENEQKVKLSLKQKRELEGSLTALTKTKEKYDQEIIALDKKCKNTQMYLSKLKTKKKLPEIDKEKCLNFRQILITIDYKDKEKATIQENLEFLKKQQLDRELKLDELEKNRVENEKELVNLSNLSETQLKEQIHQREKLLEASLQKMESNRHILKRQLELQSKNETLENKIEILKTKINHLIERKELQKEQQEEIKNLLNQQDYLLALEKVWNKSVEENSCNICQTPMDSIQIPSPLQSKDFEDNLNIKEQDINNKLKEIELECHTKQIQVDELEKQILENNKNIIGNTLTFKTETELIADFEKTHQELKEKIQGLRKKVQQFNTLNQAVKTGRSMTLEVKKQLGDILHQCHTGQEQTNLINKELKTLKDKIPLQLSIEKLDGELELYTQIEKNEVELKNIQQESKEKRGQIDIYRKQINDLITAINDQKLILEKNYQQYPELKQNLSPKDELMALEESVKELSNRESKAKKEFHDADLKRNNTLGQIDLIEKNIREIHTPLLKEARKLMQQNFFSDEIVKNQENKILENDLEISLNENSFLLIMQSIELQLKEECEFFLNCKEKVNSTLVEINTKLELFENKSRELNELNNHLQVERNKEKDNELLQNLLGKEEFRNFALGLIQDQLIELTNQELQYFVEGRYQLLQMQKNNSWDFYVFDKFYPGEFRKISTLSGGETFLVSLALSLSLAEMTRGKTQIDTFIIDEGFGSLDSDSIDEVIEVLENLKNRGKIIGLISHIKGLTERISTNINLEKSANGHSEINIVYN